MFLFCFVLYLQHQCCGKPLDLTRVSLEGIAVLNIPSMHGGSNLWGESKKSDGVAGLEQSEVITDPEALKIVSQGETAVYTPESSHIIVIDCSADLTFTNTVNLLCFLTTPQI